MRYRSLAGKIYCLSAVIFFALIIIARAAAAPVPSLVPPVTVTAAGAGGCDYRSTDPKTCCVCESSTMCLAESGFYRTCDAVTGADGKSGNCYSVEKKCTTAVCQSDDSINNPLQPCPDAKASDFKCASAGSISSLSQQDGATYLDICDKSFKEINAQCTLSTKQKYAAVCYEASKNGLPAALALIDRQGYGFTIKDNDPGVKVAKGLFIVNQDGITACQDIAATELSLSDLENQIKSNLGDSWDTVRLACCLTDDHCKARGCDEKIVYDSVHQGYFRLRQRDFICRQLRSLRAVKRRPRHKLLVS